MKVYPLPRYHKPGPGPSRRTHKRKKKPATTYELAQRNIQAAQNRHARVIRQANLNQQAQNDAKIPAIVRPAKLAGDFLNSPEWRALAYAAKVLYGTRCMCCGASAVTTVICADHIHSRSSRPAWALKMTNIQILCRECNQGKGSYDFTDFRSEDQKVAATNWRPNYVMYKDIPIRK